MLSQNTLAKLVSDSRSLLLGLGLLTLAGCRAHQGQPAEARADVKSDPTPAPTDTASSVPLSSYEERLIFNYTEIGNVLLNQFLRKNATFVARDGKLALAFKGLDTNSPLAEFAKYSHGIQKVLDKLPSDAGQNLTKSTCGYQPGNHQSIYYRGISSEPWVSRAFVEGEVFVTKQFLSTSIAPGIAIGFSAVGPKVSPDSSVVFEIVASNAKSIVAFSDMPRERERLVPPGSLFRVGKIGPLEMVGDEGMGLAKYNVTRICLQEVALDDSSLSAQDHAKLKKWYMADSPVLVSPDEPTELAVVECWDKAAGKAMVRCMARELCESLGDGFSAERRACMKATKKKLETSCAEADRECMLKAKMVTEPEAP